MNKVVNFFKRILYALPFGLKGADAEINGSGADSDGTILSQNVNDGRVSTHLLKGEVTQEVEELRYRTYKVERESYNYKYIGNGIAVKKEKDAKTNDVIKFKQENKLICNSVLDELKNIDSYGFETYNINLTYNLMPKIKIEKFITDIDVNIRISENKALTTLNFSSIPNPSEFTSKPFVASLKALYEAYNNKDMRYVNNSDFNMISTMFFVTTNMDDDEFNAVSYNFCDPVITNVEQNNAEYKITYSWGKYDRTDLTDKFYVKELDEKYKKKAKKDIQSSQNDIYI